MSSSAPPEIEESQHKSDSEVKKSPNYSPLVHSLNDTTLTTHDLNFEESSSQDEVGPFLGQNVKEMKKTHQTTSLNCVEICQLKMSTGCHQMKR